ncbi:hypothetical protein VTN02DRAFT_3764 [Thermoascus thermophilus]
MKTFLVLLAALVACLLRPSRASVLLPPDDPTGRESDTRQVPPEVFESLEELARLVDISYCVGSTGIQPPFQCLSRCSEFKGFELVTTWNTGPLLSDSCGYIALSHPPFPRRIIVAFRGTYSITNTILDLSAVPQAYVPYPADGDGQQDKCANCTVHAGFMTSWQTARSTVLSHVSTALQQHPDYEVVLVGHSLGGAVAALAGLEMQLRGWKPQVTTFGEPRIGNAALVRFIDETFNLTGPSSMADKGNQRGQRNTYCRVTHVNDPVPLLPLEQWGYEMHAGEIYISKPSIPPYVSDLEYCDGDQDPRCIAGSAESESVFGVLRDPYLLSAIRDLDPETETDMLMAQEEENSFISQTGEGGKDINAQWPLIPRRYRPWDLFFAHRDYFWRLGLCVPGGDPTRVLRDGSVA